MDDAATAAGGASSAATGGSDVTYAFAVVFSWCPPTPAKYTRNGLIGRPQNGKERWGRTGVLLALEG